MPLAMSVVWDVIKNDKKSIKFAKLLEKFDTVLGLKLDKQEEEEKLPQNIINLAEERKLARNQKNWELSDKLRDEITNLGYSIKDVTDGYEITKI